MIKRCQDDTAPTVQVLQLSEAALSEAYQFVSKVASEVAEGKLTYKDKWLAVKIKNKQLTLSCPAKQKSCQVTQEIMTTSGYRIRVCPALMQLFDFLRKKEDEKKPSPRPVLKTKKVGRYLYKLQPNSGGNNYWYLQFTQSGRSMQVYLGKDKPEFNPEADLRKAELRKSRKPRAMAAVG